ncbi:MAG: RraA family protein, partial [Bacteroidota bacterium]|nr:RraA family protein [Bacteroidota bacterium]
MILKKLTKSPFIIFCVLTLNNSFAQNLSVDQMKFLTHRWEGERFGDGRPKVPADILERMKKVTIEEAWGVLRNEGFHNQFEGGWEPLHDDV